MYSYGPPHMAKQKQDDQPELTYSSYVRTQDVTQKTCRRRWMIGRSGERWSGISVLAERHDDDDDLSLSLSLCICVCASLYLNVFILFSVSLLYLSVFVSLTVSFLSLSVCLYIYIYIYIYTRSEISYSTKILNKSYLLQSHNSQSFLSLKSAILKLKLIPLNLKFEHYFSQWLGCSSLGTWHTQPIWSLRRCYDILITHKWSHVTIS